MGLLGAHGPTPTRMKGGDEGLAMVLILMRILKMSEGKVLEEGLVKRIKTAIRLGRSARHVPAKVSAISVQHTDSILKRERFTKLISRLLDRFSKLATFLSHSQGSESKCPFAR